MVDIWSFNLNYVIVFDFIVCLLFNRVDLVNLVNEVVLLVGRVSKLEVGNLEFF